MKGIKRHDLRPLYEETASTVVLVNCESRHNARWLAGLGCVFIQGVVALQKSSGFMSHV